LSFILISYFLLDLGLPIDLFVGVLSIRKFIWRSWWDGYGCLGGRI